MDTILVVSMEMCTNTVRKICTAKINLRAAVVLYGTYYFDTSGQTEKLSIISQYFCTVALIKTKKNLQRWCNQSRHSCPSIHQ